MGMFDSIKCELPLLNLPQGILNRWVLKKGETAKSSDVIFQTKDTPDQGLSLYKIDTTGQLLEEKVEGYYDEPKLTEKTIVNDPDRKEPQPSLFESLGKYNVTSRSWEKVNFTGTINFYDSYEHPDKPKRVWESIKNKNNDEFYRYTSGWIEYTVQLIDGKVQGDIILGEHTEPIKHTDEEVAAQAEKYAKQREKDIVAFKENRKKYPSEQDKLIDEIYKIAKASALDAESFRDVTKYERDLVAEHILGCIDSYREKFDIWYTYED